MIKKSILLLSALACIAGNANAQRCATDQVNADFLKQHPEIGTYQDLLNKDYRAQQDAKNGMLSSIAKFTYPYVNPNSDTAYKNVTIPVVIHVVHDYGTEYISDNEIYDWVERMNVVYRKANTDLTDVIDQFKPYVGKASVQFRLATKDPLGNPTKGITRFQSYLTKGGDDQAKFDIWAPERYLNIWLIRFIGRGIGQGVVAAYSTFPATAAVAPYSDGIIGGAAFLNENKTYEHEIGHYLNLQHPWSNNNKQAGEACGDDEVDDTPPTTGHFGSGISGPETGGNCNRLITRYDYDSSCIDLKGYFPNPGFELWNADTLYVTTPVLDTFYSSVPAGWDNLNRTFAPEGLATAIKGTTGNVSGGNHIQLVTDTISTSQLIPGRIVNGSIDKTTFAPLAGIPYRFRPRSLEGYWRYTPAGSDQGYVSVVLTKWNATTNSRYVVGSVRQDLAGTVNDWTRFRLPINYGTDTATAPDSMMIVLSASSDNAAVNARGSFLHVDDVALVDGNDGYYRIYGNDTADYPDIANVQNIMDYADCPLMFTHRQVDRMRAALNSTVGKRNNLILAENLQVTGVADAAGNLIARPDLKPVPDFSVEKVTGVSPERSYFLCADGTQSFNFKDRSWRDTISGSSSIAWQFSTGVTPNTANTANNGTISVKTTTPGWMSVNLTATGNNSGDSTIERKNVAYAADPTTVIDAQNAGYFQEFNEGGDLDKWPIFNYYNNAFKWEVVKDKGFYDNTSIVYRGYDRRDFPGVYVGAAGSVSISGQTVTSLSKDVDDFFTPAFDLRGMASGDCNLSFMSSGVSRTNDLGLMKDTLEIAYSNNCGASWTTFANLNKGTLANKGSLGILYAPLWQGDWELRSMNIPAGARTERVYFRFRYKPSIDFNSPFDLATGNDFYIDRINVSGFPLGVNTLVKDRNIAVAPNPTNSNAFVIVKGNTNTSAAVVVTDITGKVVYKTQQTLGSAVTRIEIPASAIEVKGIYVVQVVMGNETHTEKLVVR